MARSCGGVDTNRLTSTSTLVDFDGDLSVAFILKTTDATAAASDATWWLNAWLIDKDLAGTGNAGWAITLGGGKVKLVIRDDVLTQNTACNDGADHSIVCTRKASDGVCKIYLDGSEDTGGGVAKTTSAINNTKDIIIGGGNLTTGATATYAEVAVWNAVLGDAETVALSKRFSPALIRPTALKMYAPLVRGLEDRCGVVLTETGSTSIAVHPRMITPRRRRSGEFTTAAAATTTPKLIGGSLIRPNLVRGRLAA